jgi:DNA polymerase-1
MGDLIPSPDPYDKAVVIDVETTGLEWWKEKLIGVGMYFVPTYRPFYLFETTPDQWVEWVSRNLHLDYIGHNIKFDLHFLHLPPDLVWQMKLWDTMVMVHHYDSRLEKNLVEVEKVFLGTDTKEQILAEAKNKRIHTWSREQVAKYGINDVQITWEIFERLNEILQSEPFNFSLVEKDMKFLKLIYQMERDGIRLDEEGVRKAIPLVEQERAMLEEQFFEAVGKRFNWRSARQLSKVLYDDMGYPRPVNPFVDPLTGIEIGRSQQSKKYNSTMVSSSLLVEKVNHSLAKAVLKLRELDKLQNSFENLLNYSHNGIIHSNFNLTGTKTGRLSSSKPNLQNLSDEYQTFYFSQANTDSTFNSTEIQRKEEFNVRRYIVPSPGNIFISTDYKQMEIRMFGVLSQDSNMLSLLSEDVDIHAQIAQRIWGTVTKANRDWAKQISFGLIYGMSTKSLQLRLNCSFKEAKKLMQDYWGAFPSLKTWWNGVVKECEKKGYLRYWSGRLWREDDLSKMYRGVNALIQGGCADLLSIAVLRLYRWITQNNLPMRIVNLIHDEILLDAHHDCLEYLDEVQEILEVKDIFGIPFITEAKVGETYGTLHAVKS